MKHSLHMTEKKRAFLTGTLLLTGTGFACRILGFFYRIFLSRTIGAEGLGIYHMIHPVFGICFALCAGSIQTALSQYVASHMEKGRTVFYTGLAISMSMSLGLAWLICSQSAFLADRILMEPRCAPYLPLMGLSVPFAALHACINGYYYGVQKAKIPAFSQMAEQVLRMTAVFLIAAAWTKKGGVITVQLAVLGHLAGEAAAAACTLLSMLFFPPQSRSFSGGSGPTAVPLMVLALPLMGSRLVLNLLASAEAVWIPRCLKMYGLDSSGAFAVYGVLTGMALPFILFPSAITNSMAVLLLPNVAKAQAEGQKRHITACITMSLRCSMYMGILCIGIFTVFGNALGISVFHSAEAGRFMQVLAWLCPFLYLATTMGSILNGLGRTRATFLQNTASMILRIGFILLGVPAFGIMAYLWGMLCSELFLALIHLWSLRRLCPFSWNAWEMIVRPAAVLVIATGIHRFTTAIHPRTGQLPLFFDTALRIGFFCFCYAGLLALFHFGKKGRSLS
ncbi:MAG: oligosaccharide flippase family protein [Eubacteriales bacterium]|nr:oligosaccharide flippase family protein [Eubacteriales bacterium]